jgi:hypothetical protein
MSRPLPGKRWRTLAHERGKPVEQHDRGTFDELVIDSWFHLEQMSPRTYWMRVAGLHLNATMHPSGLVTLTGWDDLGDVPPIDSPNRRETAEWWHTGPANERRGKW